MTKNPRTASVRGLRTLAALLLVAGFYVLSLATAIGLVFATRALWARTGDLRVLALIFLAGVVLWALVPTQADKRAPGVRLISSQHPRLFAELEYVARALNQKMPRDVYLTLEANAWVSQLDGFLGLGGKRVMGLGLPLLQGVTRPQMRAILAHEFGHFHGGDTRLGPFLYQARAAMQRTVERMNHSALALPFAWYGRFFIKVTHALSREQERTADRLAAAVVSSGAYAIALRRVSAVASAFGAFWRREFNPAFRAGVCPPLFEGFRLYLQAPAVVTGMDVAVKHELSQVQMKPWDTHPPLAERLAALAGRGASAGQTGNTEEPAALTLLDRHELLERQMIAWASPTASADKLERVLWEDLPARVHIPFWEAHQRRFGPALSGLRTNNIVDTLAAWPALYRRLNECAGRPLNVQEARGLAADTIATALVLALRREGWTLQTRVGFELSLRSGAKEVEPFPLARRVLASKGHDWEAERDRLGIPVVALDPLPAADPTQVRDASFPPAWWDLEPATAVQGALAGTMFYGWGPRESLDPDEARVAAEHGFHTESVRKVKWFTVALIPIVPLGTYRVVGRRRRWGQRELWYLVQREGSDWSQVARHYALVLALAVAGTTWWSHIPAAGSPAALERDCDRGDGESCHSLGQDYSEGTRVPQDLARAAVLYRRACDIGDGGGCNDLGYAAINGLGVPRDPVAAAAVYERGCGLRVPLACSNLAVMLDSGEGIAADLQRALALFQQGCDGGDANACGMLGDIYAHPGRRAMPRDVEQARNFLGKACRGGDTGACRDLAALRE